MLDSPGAGMPNSHQRSSAIGIENPRRLLEFGARRAAVELFAATRGDAELLAVESDADATHAHGPVERQIGAVWLLLVAQRAGKSLAFGRRPRPAP